jgi:hypothetical protein
MAAALLAEGEGGGRGGLVMEVTGIVPIRKLGIELAC